MIAKRFGMRITKEKGENVLWKWTKNCVYLSMFSISVPFILLTFSVVGLGHKLKLFLLTKRFPYLDFSRSNTIRTLVDTSKNPGILHFLIKVRGESCDVDAIRESYQTMLDKKDRNGKFLYPRLRCLLIVCWNQYAFVKNFDEFKIENHVKIGPTTFKTQPISEENIQECVNLVVSKYMSPNIPPWQVKIIPMGTEKAFYLMIRIHHLILDEQKNLNVSDMMLLDKSKGMRISPQVSFNDFPLMKSPLTDIIKKPKDALEIYDDFVEFLTDRWNSFVHRHDSLDHHDGLVKKPKGVTELLSSVIMTVFNTQLEYKHCAGKALAKTSDPQLHFRFWMKLMYEEFERRQLSFKVILSVYLNAINPLNIATEIVKLLWWTVITWTFLSPWYIWREVETVHRFVFLNQTVATNTIVGFLINYVPLVAGSVKEFFYFLSIIFNGPRLFFEEAFSSSKKGEISPHCLQSTTLCGRKVVSWSGQISCEELQAKCRRNQQTHSEILLSTVSSCLMNFYSKTSFVPAQVGINFRSIPYKYLFGSKFKRNGVIGMRLPVESTSVNQLVGIRNQIKQAREQQIIVYLLSIIQIKFEFLTTVLPSSWLKILINFLSKKYSITVAEVLGFNKPEPQDYSTTFGGEIVDVLFFRTPQANTSSAITFQRFKNKIRMCLMCDINFLGQQHLISSHFVDAFHQIPVVRQAVK